jgi:hypothetical protein
MPVPRSPPLKPAARSGSIPRAASTTRADAGMARPRPESS